MANLQLIKILAEKKKIPITELAARVGVSENQIHLMSRTNSTKITTLEKIAKVLDVPITCFFDEQPAGVTTNGDYSAGAVGGNATVNVGDAVLMERIKWMEAMLNEKDERIRDLQSRLTSTH